MNFQCVNCELDQDWVVDQAAISHIMAPHVKPPDFSTNLSLQEFKQRLEASQLLSSEQVSEVYAAAGATNAGQEIDTVAFARLLCDQDLLTSAQVDLLLKGQFKGFYVGNYQLRQRVEKHNFGSVYLAQHCFLRRKALIRFYYRFDDSLRVAFFRRLEVRSQLHHGGLSEILECGQQQGMMYVVQKLPGNRNLQAFSQGKQKINLETFGKIGLQVLDVLRVAHKNNFQFLDLSPPTITIKDNGCVSLDSVGVSLEEIRQFPDRGFPYASFKAPEVRQGLADSRADLFSFGCILHELSLGLEQSNERGKSTIANLCQALTSAEPSSRPTREAVVEALQELV